jgi:hypothetical protein
MGHEAIAYGRIVGASWQVGDRFTWTHDLNRAALAAVPTEDNWPWCRSSFLVGIMVGQMG